METKGIGRKTILRIIELTDSLPDQPHAVTALLQNIKRQCPKTRIPTFSELEEGMQRAEDILTVSAKLEIKNVNYHDPNYPTLLKQMEDPPLILFAKGDLKSLECGVNIAVVGTRTPTNYGAQCAKKIGRALAEMAVTVVGGLAIGCDAEGHTGCLDGGGKTAAILAHGLDMVYPKENAKLASRIVSSGGCLLSEYPIGKRPQKNFFIERDRLQSGISNGIIVIETDIKGGTMHTVRYSIKQNRVLGCLVPGPKVNGLPIVRGNHMLLNELKAYPISKKDDLPGFLQLCHCIVPGLPSTTQEVGQKRLFD